MEIINEAEKAAEKDIWSLMQFTENLRRKHGKEPYSMEFLLKKLYVRRMAADLGIKRIYASEKMVGMKTNMSKKVFKLITDSMASDAHRNSLEFEDDQIKVLMLVLVCICRSVVCIFLLVHVMDCCIAQYVLLCSMTTETKPITIFPKAPWR